MAAHSETHARIRLNFVNLPLDSTWMLIDYKKLPLISDIVYEIKKRYFGDSTLLSLSLQGSWLPLQEKSFLLRDEDIVVVRIDEGDNESNQDIRNSSKISNVSASVGKKRKRKHGEVETSQEENISMQEDRKDKKKKKKEKKNRERERLKESTELVTEITSGSSKDSDQGKSGKCDDNSSIDTSETPAKRTRVEKRVASKGEDPKVLDGSGSFVDELALSGTKRNRDKESIKEASDDIDADSQTLKKHKRKRKRKHNKGSKRKLRDAVDEMFAVNSVTPGQELASKDDPSPSVQLQHNEPYSGKERNWDNQENTYKGKSVDVSKTFYGALPDKLLQPQYYRHQYRNLKAFKAEPNKRTKFYSDSENEEKVETQNYEQYNFLCSTRYSEFQESNSQESTNTVESPRCIPDQMNDSAVSNKSLYSPSTSLNNNTRTPEPSINDRLSTLSNTEMDNSKGELHENSRVENIVHADPEKETHINHNVYNINNNSFKMHNGCSEAINEVTAPSPLIQSTLPNGVTVYSRRRRNYPKSEMFTKEDQLNTVATNKSFIFKNPGKTDTNGEFNVGVGETLEAVKVKKDYASFPALAGPPRIGDKIAYRILEMSSAYTPEVSGYKEAEVLAFDHTTQNVHLKSTCKSDENKDMFPNKFEVSVEDEDTILTNVQQDSDETILHWSSLLEPRLVS